MRTELVFTGGPRDGGVWPWNVDSPERIRIPVPYGVDAERYPTIVVGEYRQTDRRDDTGRLIYQWFPGA